MEKYFILTIHHKHQGTKDVQVMLTLFPPPEPFLSAVAARHDRKAMLSAWVRGEVEVLWSSKACSSEGADFYRRNRSHAVFHHPLMSPGVSLYSVDYRIEETSSIELMKNGISTCGKITNLSKYLQSCRWIEPSAPFLFRFDIDIEVVSRWYLAGIQLIWRWYRDRHRSPLLKYTIVMLWSKTLRYHLKSYVECPRMSSNVLTQFPYRTIQYCTVLYWTILLSESESDSNDIFPFFLFFSRNQVWPFLALGRRKLSAWKSTERSRRCCPVPWILTTLISTMLRLLLPRRRLLEWFLWSSYLRTSFQRWRVRLSQERRRLVGYCIELNWIELIWGEQNLIEVG